MPPGVASTNPTGCPDSEAIRLDCATSTGKNRLQARVISTGAALRLPARASSSGGCNSPRGRTKSERRFETSSFTGRKRFQEARRGAHYYVTVSSSYAPGIAECARGQVVDRAGAPQILSRPACRSATLFNHRG